MIVSNCRRRLEQRRRGAFTLLEVLVVMAILVVLASVASVYFFRYLDDARKDKAKLQAKNIQTAAKAYMLRVSEKPTPDILINPGQGQKPYLEGGQDAIKTPWNTPYEIDLQTRGDSAEEAVVVRWKDGDGNTQQFPEK